jgi:hypothetical protein
MVRQLPPASFSMTDSAAADLRCLLHEDVNLPINL